MENQGIDPRVSAFRGQAGCGRYLRGEREGGREEGTEGGGEARRISKSVVSRQLGTGLLLRRTLSNKTLLEEAPGLCSSAQSRGGVSFPQQHRVSIWDPQMLSCQVPVHARPLPSLTGFLLSSSSGHIRTGSKIHDP